MNTHAGRPSDEVMVSAYLQELELGAVPAQASHFAEKEKPMKQKLDERHEIVVGNPSGGETAGIGIAIKWQNGPLGRGETRKEPNGAFVENVIQAAIGRLQFYQAAMGGKFACRANDHAITKLEEALMWLEKRTADREAREVEGVYAP